jgi:transcription elongation factor S-II
MIVNPTLFRKNVVAKFTEKIEPTMALNLEKGIYNWTISEATTRKVLKKWSNRYFSTIYIDRFRSIWMNLSEEIIEKIKSKEVRPETVAFMTHQELNPKKWKDAIQRKMLRDKNKYETIIEAASDSFKCRKCHQNKTTFYQLQTRSADEPMTTFVTCLNCGARWRC